MFLMNEMVSIHFLSAVFVSLFTIVPVLATLRDGECEGTSAFFLISLMFSNAFV